MNSNDEQVVTPEKTDNNRNVNHCKHCKMEIVATAKVCHNCGKHQNMVWFYLDKFALVGSIILVLLAFMQFYQARQKNIQATEALNEAKDAKIKVKALNEIIIESQNSLKTLKRISENASNEAREANLNIQTIDNIINESQGKLIILKDLVEKATNDANDAKLKTTELNEVLEESKENLSVLRSNVEFLEIMLSAQNDDFAAFDQLYKWSKDSSHPFQKVAINATIRLRTEYAGQIIHGHLNINWGNGITPDQISFDHLRQYYENLDPVYHADLVQLIWERKDIQKMDKMSFFVRILRNSNSLTAKHDAARYFIKCANDENLKWSPFKIDPLLEWWETNKTKMQ